MENKSITKSWIFILLALISVIVLLFFLVSPSLYFKKTHYVIVDQLVNELTLNQVVTINGLKVGEVIDIKIDKADNSLNAKIKIDENIKIPVNSFLLIENAEIVGNPSLSIVMGDMSNYLHSGDTLPIFNTTLYEQYGQTLNALRSGLNELIGTIESALAVSEDFSFSMPDQKHTPDLDNAEDEINNRYKVQLGAYQSRKRVNMFNLSSLGEVEEFYHQGYYKYMIGNTVSFEEAQVLQKEVIRLGFNDAFIVLFSEGKRKAFYNTRHDK
ncbi:MAG: MCE family protein [Bacteroidales bacterium]|nr:MCE family protein [Bacteroidales bacterium]